MITCLVEDRIQEVGSIEVGKGVNMKTISKAHVWHLSLVMGIGFAAIVVAVLMIKVVAASYSKELKSNSSSSIETNNGRSSPMLVSAQPARVEAELITILPTGFEPAQITRPSGKFLLAVENRSGISQIDFQLSAESGNRIVEVSRTWERSDWSDVVNPPPGRYVLTERNHPAWQCVITITQ
jgi:hypothetical protein